MSIDIKIKATIKVRLNKAGSENKHVAANIEWTAMNQSVFVLVVRGVFIFVRLNRSR